MKVSSLWLNRACALLGLLVLTAVPAFSTRPQEKPKEKPAQVSDGERKAVQKLNDAKDPTAKMRVASEFVLKFPTSSLRPRIVDVLIKEIAGVSDSAQKITLAENFLGTFMEASEANRMYPVLIDAYVAAKRVDDAFNAAKPWLEVNPNEVDVLYLLAVVGTDEARRENLQFVASSEQYGRKAIELIEADKRPEGIPVENWNKTKSAWLPQLYQSMGVIALLNKKTSEAFAKLQKAAALNQSDPLNYILLGNLKNDEYTSAARQFQAMPAGQTRIDAEKSLFARLDEVIDLFAHALGLMDAKPQYQQLSEQMLSDLTTFYKFRHKSTNGMQELIQKYKRPATP